MAHHRWEPQNKATVIRIYREQRQTVREQAKALGVHPETLYIFLRRQQVPLRSGSSRGCIKPRSGPAYRSLHPCPRGCQHDDGRPVLVAAGQPGCIACAVLVIAERARRVE